MKHLKKFLREELTGWTPLSVCWLCVATAVILGLSLYWKDTAVGTVSALTGVWCVILTGQGKRSSFIFGVVNTLCYAWVSYGARYYGEVMLNLVYYFPMNFVGFYMWSKHLDSRTGEVVKARLPLKKGLAVYSLTGIGIFLYGLLLKALGGALPYTDSMSTVVSVTAQLLSVWRLAEQWVLWVVVDIVTVVMWAIQFAKGGESIATLAMWSVYLINAVIMLVKWMKEAKKA